MSTAQQAQQAQKPGSVVWSVQAVRLFVGWTAIVFPPVLWFGYLFFERTVHPGSISAYYYSSMQNAFVGFLVVLGASLIYYQYRTIDNWVSTIAGLSAIGVAFFPMAPTDHTPTDWQQRVGYAHFAFAATSLIALAVMALFLFTRPARALDQTRVNVSYLVHQVPWFRNLPQTRAQLPQNLTKQKHWRNQVYEICGVIIVLCVVLLALTNFNVLRIPSQVHPVYWLESVAVWAFGVAWIVKGGAFLRNGPQAQQGQQPQQPQQSQPQPAPSSTPLS